MTASRLASLSLCLALTAGCGDDPVATTDSGVDAATDAAITTDTPVTDTPSVDAATDAAPSPGGTELARSRFAGAFGFVTGLARASDGDLVVSAVLHGPGTVGTTRVEAPAERDTAVLMRVSPAGALRWATALGGATGGAARLARVAIGATDVIRVASEIEGGDMTMPASLDLGGAVMRGAFVASFGGADGRHVWSRQISAASVYGVAVDGANVVVSGIAQAGFAVGTQSYPIPDSNRRGFVAALDPSGTPRWATLVGGAQPNLYGVGVDGSGNVLAAGYSESPLVVGTTTIPAAHGLSEVYALTFGRDGAFTRGRSFGNDQHNFAFTLAATADGDMVTAWSTSGTSGYTVARVSSAVEAPRWQLAVPFEIEQVAAGADGSVALFGSFQSAMSPVMLGAVRLEAPAGTATDGVVPVVARLDPTGAVAWARLAANTQTNGKVLVDTDGSVWLAASGPAAMPGVQLVHYAR